ncbi:flagellar M-ring protein FliF [Denitrovibrio acetiphilus DSM 12809]|uniref:Flagellar M-ring protein n=1 Tax=Denitrovibrio acetiphilus (strain DSM 12809 / NBRC 114555 / N2460) TaxID=522772 RepID=D4H353_DENA2|nr:flagellar basal-body MS-ring/collar protein FliF [Denitrovibrio acetiphilus]ADD69076.1 flagellar M-ring protein FliF [Denitrovibrio acetiphilus DSM 12809]
MALSDIASQFKDTYLKLSLLQKISVAAALAAVFISVAVIVYWANRPVYKTLFAGMTQDDAALVVDSLKEQRIPYKLEDGGAKITIPDQYVYETRLNLAKENIPRGGGAGLELFDKSSFGMTEFMQNVSYQRALQGELARTITALKEIQEARVHLTVSKDRLFIADEEASKAAVVLRLRSGASLGRAEVQAIASLVSGAVKGLSPENVQIVDTQGRLLSEFLDEENSPLMMTQSQLEYTKKIERDLERKVNEILGATLGKGNAVAKVTAEIDFNKRDVTKEEYGDTPVLRSQQSMEISSTNKPDGPQGIPGVQSNLAEPDIGTAGRNQEYNKTEDTQNFEINKTITVEQKAYGTIDRVTVAVVVDDRKIRQQDDNGESTIVSQRRSDDEMRSIRNLVAMAVGYNEPRGDQIEVTNISFDTTSKDHEYDTLKREKTMELVGMVSKYLLAALIVLLFYFLVIRRILKRLDKPVTVHEDGSITYGQIDGEMGIDITLDDSYPKTLEELEREIESELEESSPMDVDTVKSKVMLKKIEEFATEDPDAMASLLKTLMRGDN